jgi:hypothetical protein
MSKINFTPAENQITKLPEEPTMLDTNDVGFATYAKGDKSRSGDPVDAVLLDIDAYANQKGVVNVRLLFGILSGKSYDGIDVTGRTIAGDKNLSENAAQYSSGDLTIMGLIDPNDPKADETLVERVCEPTEKEKLLCNKVYRVSVEESLFETKNGAKLQRRVGSVTQPAAKLSKAEMLAKLKSSNFLGAIAKAKAGNKPGEKLPTSPPPANQRPAAGDPFAVSAPGFVADPGAGDLGSL